MATTNWAATPSLNNTTAQAGQLPDQTTTPAGAPFTQAGLISSNVVPGTQAAQFNANLQSVNQGETVAGNLDKMLAADSPYLQRARSQAAATSNAKGLLNSSMAAGAGVAAGIDAATPIAQADANIYTNARDRNQDALNTGGQFNVSQANTFALADKEQQADLKKMEINQGYTQQNMGLAQQFDLTKMDVQSANTLKQMSAQEQIDLAKMAKAQGYNLDTMTVQQINDLQKAAVIQGYDLTKMDKQAALTLQQMDAQQILDLKKMATAQGYNLETMDAQQINDLAKMTVANQFDLNKMAIAQGYTIETLQAATKEDLIKMATSQGYDLVKMATAQGFDIDKMDKQQLFDLAKLDKTFTQQEKEAQIKFGYDKNLIAMQQASAKEIALIDNKYKALIQASASATSLSNTVSGHIQDILTSDLDTEAKTAAIAQIQGNYENSLALIGSLAGDVDLQSFFGEILGIPSTTSPTTPAAPALTADQQTSINTFWAQNQNNPQAVIQAMTTYGVDAAGLAQATGQTVQQVAAYLQAAGAPPGFGGVNYGATQSTQTPPSQTPQITTQAGLINSDPTVVGGPATGTASPVTVNNVTPASPSTIQNPGGNWPQSASDHMANTSKEEIAKFYTRFGGNIRALASEMMSKNLSAEDVATALGLNVQNFVENLTRGGAPVRMYNSTTNQPTAQVSTGPSYDPTATPVVGGGLIRTGGYRP